MQILSSTTAIEELEGEERERDGEEGRGTCFVFCTVSALGHYDACEPQHFGEAKNMLELCLHFPLHPLKPVPQLGSWAHIRGAV